MPLPSETQTVEIALDERSYPILIGAGLLDHAASFDRVGAGSSALIVSNTTVAPLYAERLVRARANTLVVRSGLWIGPSATGRIGHLDWLRHRHRRGLPMTVVADEVRSAVWAADAAARVWALARSPLTGVRHITATRAVARPELARHVDRHFAIGATFGASIGAFAPSIQILPGLPTNPGSTPVGTFVTRPVVLLM